MASDHLKIFSTFFKIAQRWQSLGDKYLASENLTTKQWLMLRSLYLSFTDPPSLGELATSLGTSRQNTKQLALKLQKSWFILLTKDEIDTRATRVKLTTKGRSLIAERLEKDDANISVLFTGFTEEEIRILGSSIKKLEALTAKMVR